MNKLVFGMVLITLAVFAIPVTADNVFYLVPPSSTGDSGDEVYVEVMLNASDTTDAFDAEIWFDIDVVNITAGQNPGSTWDWWEMGRSPRGGGTYVHIGAMDFGGGSNGVISLANITLKGNNTGTSTLHFDIEYSGCGFQGNSLPETFIDGTFTCTGEAETFEKDLALGWNLISLPLTPSDNSVSTVLSGVSHDAVMQYDATTKTFADATTMDPGIGYFVDVTSASTWEYEGTSVSSTSPGLKSGLNMIGVPNCTMDVSTAMGSADYRYVARWNADDQKYEVYNPSAPAAFHGFTTMAAGEGYFISAGSDDDTFAISCPS